MSLVLSLWNKEMDSLPHEGYKYIGRSQSTEIIFKIANEEKIIIY